MQSAEQEVFRELRQERLWRLTERAALWVVYATVGVLLVGLVSAATVVLMDGLTLRWRSPVSRPLPTIKAAEMAEQRAKSGLPLTADQYAKLMHSAKLADEALERKRLEREAAKKAEREARAGGRS